MTTMITERDFVQFHNPSEYHRATELMQYYRALAKTEEAWKVRDDALEAMMTAGALDYRELERLELRAVRWEQKADKLYAEANECECSPDASEVCASCRAYQEAIYGDAIPFGV